MTSDLAAFSDWTLALLPRLFLYPGGLFLLAAIALLRLGSHGAGALTPRASLRDLAGANSLSLALAWVAVALLPLPSWQLPFAPDAPTLALLLALSLLLDIRGGRKREQALAGGAITLALLVPAVGVETGTILWTAVGLAVLAGVYALGTTTADSLTAQARAVGWVWIWLSAGLAFLEQEWLALVLLPAAALVVGLVLRVARGRKGVSAAALPAIAWSLALLALLAALLLGR